MKRMRMGHLFAVVLVLASVLIFTACPGGIPGVKIPLSKPSNVTIREVDFTLTWGSVSNAAAYVVSIDGKPEYPTMNTEFSLERLTMDPKEHQISVKAVAPSTGNFEDSGYSDPISCEPGDVIFEHSGKVEAKARAVGDPIIITGLTAYGKTLANIVIPDAIGGSAVEVIAEEAFANSNIESVVIAASIKKIEASAFINCETLTTVTFASSETASELDLAANAFENCIAIENIIVPADSDDAFKEKIVAALPPEVAANEEIIKTEVVHVTEVTIGKTTLSLEEGKREILVATVAPTDAVNKNVIWSSSNTKVAEVSKEGEVYAISAGTAIITVTTVDAGETATCTVTVTAPPAPPPVEELPVDEQIASAFEDLTEGDYDSAIARFEAAYASDETNKEAIVYSALAKLAAISVDPKVKTLLQSKLGLKAYPGSMNALLNGSWLEEYKNAVNIRSLTLKVSEDGNYVRANGNLMRSSSPSIPEGYVYIDYLRSTDTSNHWVDRWDHYIIQNGYFDSSDEVPYYYLEITGFSDSGNYLVNYWDMQNYPDLGTSQRYEVDYVNSEYVYVASKADSSVSAPGFNIPSWFANTDAYAGTLVEGVQTSQTIMMLMLANVLEGNVDGLNGLIDGILDSVFGDSFEAVANRIDELEIGDRIDLPAELIEGLDMESIMGEDYDLTVGKAELQVFTSALRLLKGTLQWIASYNLNSDLSFLKFDWSDEEAMENMVDRIEAKHDPFTNGFLDNRSSASMDRAKDSFIKALVDILESYDYLVSEENGSYPAGTKDILREYGSAFREDVDNVINAIEGENDGILTIAADKIGTEEDIKIDIGEFFTPGSFSLKNFIDGESNGEPKLYVLTEDGPKLMTKADYDALVEQGGDFGISPLPVNPDDPIEEEEYIMAGIRVKKNYWVSTLINYFEVPEEIPQDDDFIFAPLPQEVVVGLYDFYN